MWRRDQLPSKLKTGYDTWKQGIVYRYITEIFIKSKNKQPNKIHKWMEPKNTYNDIKQRILSTYRKFYLVYLKVTYFFYVKQKACI